MTEADTWCPDVITQTASATRALQEAAVGMLNDHISHCWWPRPLVGSRRRRRLGEVAAAIRQVIRL